MTHLDLLQAITRNPRRLVLDWNDDGQALRSLANKKAGYVTLSDHKQVMVGWWVTATITDKGRDYLAGLTALKKALEPSLKMLPEPTPTATDSLLDKYMFRFFQNGMLKPSLFKLPGNTVRIKWSDRGATWHHYPFTIDGNYHVINIGTGDTKRLWRIDSYFVNNGIADYVAQRACAKGEIKKVIDHAA